MSRWKNFDDGKLIHFDTYMTYIYELTRLGLAKGYGL